MYYSIEAPKQSLVVQTFREYMLRKDRSAITDCIIPYLDDNKMADIYAEIAMMVRSSGYNHEPVTATIRTGAYCDLVIYVDTHGRYPLVLKYNEDENVLYRAVFRDVKSSAFDQCIRGYMLPRFVRKTQETADQFKEIGIVFKHNGTYLPCRYLYIVDWVRADW